MSAARDSGPGRAGSPGPASGGGAALVSAAQRRTLAGLADQLIPAEDDMPAASQAGVAGRGLDELLASRPDLADDLRSLLDAAAGVDPAEAIRLYQAAPDGAAMAILSTVVPGAYYLDPDIRARIGYPGQQAIAIPDPSMDREDEALLRHVIERGPIHRS